MSAVVRPLAVVVDAQRLPVGVGVGDEGGHLVGDGDGIEALGEEPEPLAGDGVQTQHVVQSLGRLPGGGDARRGREVALLRAGAQLRQAVLAGVGQAPLAELRQSLAQGGGGDALDARELVHAGEGRRAERQERLPQAGRQALDGAAGADPTAYRRRARASRRARAGRPAQPAAKRGPKGAGTDAALTEQIRAVLARSPFIGEGYRKAWARLRLAGVRTSKGRVLRLMRAAGLLAPTRVGRRRGPQNHDGTITTDRPDELWGTDATACLTTREGNATVFIAVDHCTQECVGIHAARPGTRFEALEPLRQGLRAHHGGYGPGVAAGLSLRHDHGSQYLSDHFQGELRFLGIRSSPSFVAAPEGYGCAERFIRTLKEPAPQLRQRYVSVGAVLCRWRGGGNRSACLRAISD